MRQQLAAEMVIYSQPSFLSNAFMFLSERFGKNERLGLEAK